jgi:hypothetical protein
MNRNLLDRLEKILTHEIRVYEGYNALTELEKKFVIPFNPDKVMDAAVRRDHFVSEMKKLQTERRNVISELGFDSNTRLTTVISETLKGAEAKKFLTLANKLKKAVQSSQKDTKDLNGIIKFGMGMVDGLLSIFWSATRHVTKSYTRMGSIQESSTPAGTRASSVLKKA